MRHLPLQPLLDGKVCHKQLDKEHGSLHNSGVVHRRAFRTTASGVAESRVTSEAANRMKVSNDILKRTSRLQVKKCAHDSER